MGNNEAHDSEWLHVTLKVFGALRDLHRTSQESVALGADHTVRGLLSFLRETQPELAQKLEAGLSDGYLSCLVNGRNARFLKDLDTPLANGDVVAFLPPVGGG